jgi:hypothetical protein
MGASSALRYFFCSSRSSLTVPVGEAADFNGDYQGPEKLENE